MVMLVTYGTVAVQVAFPFTLFNRRVKNVLLAAMITEHAVIAVVLGLPFFSLAMIAADSVFLPTSFLRRLGDGAARARGRLWARLAGGGGPGAGPLGRRSSKGRPAPEGHRAPGRPGPPTDPGSAGPPRPAHRPGDDPGDPENPGHRHVGFPA